MRPDGYIHREGDRNEGVWIEVLIYFSISFSFKTGRKLSTEKQNPSLSDNLYFQQCIWALHGLCRQSFVVDAIRTPALGRGLD